MPRRCGPSFWKRSLKLREVPEVTDQSEQDIAAFKAALIVALSSMKHAAGSQSLPELLAELDSKVAVSAWPLAVARSLQPDWRAWVARPWSCIQLLRLQRQFMRGDESHRNFQDIDRVARILALIQFGVDVDTHWYRRLRIAADEHGFVRVRQLLESPWVWWGPSRTYRWSRMPALFRRLCAMGRPGHGALHYKRPHRVVAWLLAGPALLGCIFLVAAGALLTANAGVSNYQLAMAALLAAKGGVLLWTSWWLGPYGLGCIGELVMVLGPEGEGNGNLD